MKKTFLHTTHRNILWFQKSHNSEELDMKPPFQRNPVWVERQKSYLIDSILNEFPIPEIYMLDVIDSEGHAKYIVVDGQQRIRTCIEFLEGKFVMDAKDSPKWADMTFEDLSQQDKTRIYSYDFVVRLLPEMTDAELRNIFQRLNRNTVVLNRQELRQATYWGEFISTMNELSDLEIWASFDLFTANDIRRMLDVEYISELAIGSLHGVQNKKESLDKWYSLYEKEFDGKEKIKQTFNVVLGELLRVLPDLGKLRWSKKNDFYTLFILFSKHIDSLPLSAEKRKKAAALLTSFAKNMDLYVSTETGKNKLPLNVKKYGLGIRASTDLGSRKKREEALEKELAVIWKK